MARSRIEDWMQAYPFWLVDISPNLNPPFFVFNPFMGFASAGGVGLTVETEQYRPLNSSYAVSYATGATVGAIQLQRGAKMVDTDFYRWVERTVNGIDQVRRNLMLIHFLAKGSRNEAPVLPGPFSQIVRVPGRTWVLWECIPTEYGGGDLDATSGDVVMQSLTLQPTAMTEVALGALV